MSSQKLFYEIVAEVLPAGAKQTVRTGLENAATAKTGSISGSDTNASQHSNVDIRDIDNFDAIYKIASTFEPKEWIKVEKEVWWTSFKKKCASCGSVKTNYVTFVPEMIHVCSRKCLLKTNESP